MANPRSYEGSKKEVETIAKYLAKLHKPYSIQRYGKTQTISTDYTDHLAIICYCLGYADMWGDVMTRHWMRTHPTAWAEVFPMFKKAEQFGKYGVAYVPALDNPGVKMGEWRKAKAIRVRKVKGQTVIDVKQ